MTAARRPSALDLALDVPRAVLVRPIGERDVRPGASGGERDRPADPAGRAGHEHGAARQRRRDSVRHLPLPSGDGGARRIRVGQPTAQIIL